MSIITKTNISTKLWATYYTEYFNPHCNYMKREQLLSPFL